MLGEQIGEITGIIIGQRVLDVEEDCPKIEVSISGSGKFKGINVAEYGLILACIEMMDLFTVKGKV